jgi:hypothetical protein
LEERTLVEYIPANPDLGRKYFGRKEFARIHLRKSGLWSNLTLVERNLIEFNFGANRTLVEPDFGRTWSKLAFGRTDFGRTVFGRT